MKNGANGHLHSFASDLLASGMCVVPATTAKIPALEGWQAFQRNNSRSSREKFQAQSDNP